MLSVDVRYIPAVIKYAEPSALGDDVVLCTNPRCAGLGLQSRPTCASMVHLRRVDRLKLKVAFIVTGDINGCIASASPRRRDMNVRTSACIMTAAVRKWIIHIGGDVGSRTRHQAREIESGYTRARGIDGGWRTSRPRFVSAGAGRWFRCSLGSGCEGNVELLTRSDHRGRECDRHCDSV